ncbi:MAG: hypothetical protein ACRDZR_14940 [Acidimicrobiales bacterium]
MSNRSQVRRPEAGAGSGRDMSEGLGPMVDQLEAVVKALPAYLPDPGQGAEWLQFDSAVVDLHRALVSLRAIERAREQPDVRLASGPAAGPGSGLERAGITPPAGPGLS